MSEIAAAANMQLANVLPLSLLALLTKTDKALPAAVNTSLVSANRNTNILLLTVLIRVILTGQHVTADIQDVHVLLQLHVLTDAQHITPLRVLRFATAAKQIPTVTWLPKTALTDVLPTILVQNALHAKLIPIAV